MIDISPYRSAERSGQFKTKSGVDHKIDSNGLRPLKQNTVQTFLFGKPSWTALQRCCPLMAQWTFCFFSNAQRFLLIYHQSLIELLDLRLSKTSRFLTNLIHLSKGYLSTETLFTYSLSLLGSVQWNYVSWFQSLK